MRGWQTSPFGVVWFLLVNVSGTKSKKFTYKYTTPHYDNTKINDSGVYTLTVSTENAKDTRDTNLGGLCGAGNEVLMQPHFLGMQKY